MMKTNSTGRQLINKELCRSAEIAKDRSVRRTIKKRDCLS